MLGSGVNFLLRVLRCDPSSVGEYAATLCHKGKGVMRSAAALEMRWGGDYIQARFGCGENFVDGGSAALGFWISFSGLCRGSLGIVG